MSVRIFFAAALCLSLLISEASASPDVSVSEVVLAQAGASLTEEQALEIALVQSINSISGEEFALGQRRLEPFIEKLQTYLLEFETETDDERGDVLTAKFDAITLSQDLGMFDLVDDAINQSLVVLMLAIEPKKGEPLRILGRRDKGLVVDVIHQIAERRGLNILLPAMDATDRERLSPEAILIRDEAAFEKTSERYGGESYVFGLFVDDQGVWTSSLESSDKPDFTAVGESKKPMLALTQALLSVLESAPVTQTAAVVSRRVTVEQIQSWSGYAGARDYLSSLPGTQSLIAVSHRGTTAAFDVQLAVSASAWLSTIAEDGILRSIGVATARSPDLRFIMGDGAAKPSAQKKGPSE